MSNYIIRALDSNGDWLFGKGLNDYAINNAAVALDIKMNLSMFLGDCFFAMQQGINWFNLLGGKNEIALNLAINAAILNTKGVKGIQQTSISLDTNRKFTVNYKVLTVYSVLSGSFSFDVGAISA